jgi:hypothetical protein
MQQERSSIKGGSRYGHGSQDCSRHARLQALLLIPGRPDDRAAVPPRGGARRVLLRDPPPATA